MTEKMLRKNLVGVIFCPHMILAATYDRGRLLEVFGSACALMICALPLMSINFAKQYGLIAAGLPYYIALTAVMALTTFCCIAGSVAIIIYVSAMSVVETKWIGDLRNNIVRVFLDRAKECWQKGG